MMEKRVIRKNALKQPQTHGELMESFAREKINLLETMQGADENVDELLEGLYGTFRQLHHEGIDEEPLDLTSSFEALMGKKE
jgi:F0F1-type ATP synthase gamma subunit